MTECENCGNKRFFVNSEKEYARQLDSLIGEYYSITLTCTKCKKANSWITGSD